MHMNVFNSFIYKQQKMEITKMYFSMWIDEKLCDIHTMEYYSVTKGNELSCTLRHGGNLNALLSEICQSEKAYMLYDSHDKNILAKAKLWRH